MIEQELTLRPNGTDSSMIEVITLRDKKAGGPIVWGLLYDDAFTPEIREAIQREGEITVKLVLEGGE